MLRVGLAFSFVALGRVGRRALLWPRIHSYFVILLCTLSPIGFQLRGLGFALLPLS